MTKNESLDQAALQAAASTGGAAATGAADFHPEADEGDSDRNAVFGNLVKADTDIVGLVAYSIYKQNKHDWLIAFNKAKSREPQESELASYIIGESTPRRLATYLHLAEATLEGRGPATPAGPASNGAAQRNYAIAARHTPPSAPAAQQNWGFIGLVGLAFIAAIGLYLAARYGFIGTAKP